MINFKKGYFYSKTFEPCKNEIIFFKQNDNFPILKRKQTEHLPQTLIY